MTVYNMVGSVVVIGALVTMVVAAVVNIRYERRWNSDGSRRR